MPTQAWDIAQLLICFTVEDVSHVIHWHHEFLADSAEPDRAVRQMSPARGWCRQVAEEKRAAFKVEKYWGKPIPNLGSPEARLLIVGLAPAAHGGNRTGRMFTGDRSGDFLFRALFETGFANQAACLRPDDGLELIDVAITAVAHCALPQNKLMPDEIANCSTYLDCAVELMPHLRGMVCLGKVAFDACLRLYRRRGWLPAGPRLIFGHGVMHQWTGVPFLVASYHPSQQNTFTGKLTPEMLRNVFQQARIAMDTGL